MIKSSALTSLQTPVSRLLASEMREGCRQVTQSAEVETIPAYSNHCHSIGEDAPEFCSTDMVPLETPIAWERESLGVCEPHFTDEK